MKIVSGSIDAFDHRPSFTPAIRLRQLLGSGGSAVVFRAEVLPSSNRFRETAEVAVKLPKTGTSLREEASALRRFTHPNIVDVIEDHSDLAVGELAGAILVELCDEGTLEDLVMQRALTGAEVHFVVASIGSALSAMHEQGWIHGDIAPSNIGLRSNQAPCLFDFETCRPFETTSGAAITRGTEHFSDRPLPSLPVFDVRALAATALWALGAPEEYSRIDHQIADGLRHLIECCDRGESDPHTTSLDALLTLFDDVPSHPFVNPNLLDRSRRGEPTQPGLPVRSRTREFGPRPDGGLRHDGESGNGAEQVSSAPWRRQKTIALVAMLAFATLLSIEIFGVRISPAAAEEQAPPSTHAVSRVSAESSLEAFGAVWSSEHGSAQVVIDGIATSFAPGQRGDLGAIGDWNCDGRLTLGVFRPATGSWFTFEDWTPNTTSTVELLADPNPETKQLWVHTDASGCTAPSLS